MRGLKDRAAIVTGGLGDLGYAVAQRFVEEGCKVAIFDLKADDDNKAAEIQAAAYQVDISDEAGVRSVCTAAEQEIGPTTILVNCAAHFIFKGIEAEVEDWQRILAVNVMGTSLVTKHTVPQMRRAGGGAIINFSSVSGFVAQASFATYNSTKFAIRGLTRCWAEDLAPHNIRVNSICPGYFYTSAFVDSCKSLGRDVEEEDRRAGALHLLGRQGRPEEIGGAVAFLASDDASFITGSDMLVDGGFLAR